MNSSQKKIQLSIKFTYYLPLKFFETMLKFSPKVTVMSIVLYKISVDIFFQFN